MILRRFVFKSIQIIKLSNFSLSTYKKNHYEVLGVNEDACLKDIREKYLEKLKIYHPDKLNAPATEKTEGGSK
jgi:preprotein translocase subunit Sec63